MITLYTDGAAKGNPGRGGYGGILLAGTHHKKFSGGYLHTTNNRMELLAIIIGLEHLKKESQHITIYTDSLYVANPIQKGWLWKWQAQQFKKRKNIDLWQRFLSLYQRHHVTLQWVKGHAGHPLNEQCDALATNAAEQGPWDIDKGYEAQQ